MFNSRPNTTAPYRNVFEIFDVKEYNDLEIRVTDHSKSSKVTPFDSLPMVSYYRPIVTLSLKCTVFEIWLHIGWKSPKKRTPLSFGTFFGGDPLRIFRRVIPCQKVKTWGYRMVVHFTILHSLYRAQYRRVTDRRTDRRVAVAKTRYA